MKTKQETVDEFTNEVLGLLLLSFAAEQMHGEKMNLQGQAIFFKQSVARGVELLKKIHDFITKEETPIQAKVGATATTPAQPPVNGKHVPPQQPVRH